MPSGVGEARSARTIILRSGYRIKFFSLLRQRQGRFLHRVVATTGREQRAPSRRIFLRSSGRQVCALVALASTSGQDLLWRQNVGGRLCAAGRRIARGERQEAGAMRGIALIERLRRFARRGRGQRSRRKVERLIVDEPERTIRIGRY